MAHRDLFDFAGNVPTMTTTHTSKHASAYLRVASNRFESSWYRGPGDYRGWIDLGGGVKTFEHSAAKPFIGMMFDWRMDYTRYTPAAARWFSSDSPMILG